MPGTDPRDPPGHDRDLAAAFDARAAAFERSKAQSDRASLAGFVDFAALLPGARVLDAGCGPGLVAEAFLEAGCEVVGVDLSGEMVRRAQARCARFGARARFEQGSLLDLPAAIPFDAALSRAVLHHVEDKAAFAARQVALLRPGGALLALDLTADPDPAARAWSHQVQCQRDRTHAGTLTPGELIDLLGGLGLRDLRIAEEEILLDFDDWFDRGTPARPREEVRRLLLAGRARGFAPRLRADGGLDLAMGQAMMRGVRPG